MAGNQSCLEVLVTVIRTSKHDLLTTDVSTFLGVCVCVCERARGERERESRRERGVSTVKTPSRAHSTQSCATETIVIEKKNALLSDGLHTPSISSLSMQSAQWEKKIIHYRSRSGPGERRSKLFEEGSHLGTRS